MTTLKLTKNELRLQQAKLFQLQRYLPTLQLKKSLLQFEVNSVHLEISSLKNEFKVERTKAEVFSPFLLEKVNCNLLKLVDVQRVEKRYENIAGAELPIFENVVFHQPEYFLFDSPVWTETAVEILRGLVIIREKLNIAEEKRRALEKDLTEVSIRVNLFEKILIPRAQVNIKKIRIFLGDQQLAAVAQAKVAQKKILERAGNA